MSASRLASSAHRAGSAALIAVATGGVVSLLFANPEPTALANDRPAVTVTTMAALAPAVAATTTPAATAKPPASTKPAPADPRTVAAGWYATRHGLPAGKVKVLQADQLSRSKVRVLLMVEQGKGRLDSAIVTVTRSSSGWKVTSR